MNTPNLFLFINYPPNQCSLTNSNSSPPFNQIPFRENSKCPRFENGHKELPRLVAAKINLLMHPRPSWCPALLQKSL